MWLSGVVPLAYYLASASAFGGLYQEAALVGSATELGVLPAPGAPLSSLVASLLTLIPVGPLAFRVACASAVFVALGLALFARALFFSLYGLGARRSDVNAWLCLGSAWLIAQSPSAWLSGTHANIFALQWLLALAIIDALVRHELSEPTDDLRLLNFAAFVQGLAFANHYALAFLTLPAAAPTLGRVFARRGFIGVMGHAALPLFGFSAYVYVPIRAGQHPSINFGEANTWSRLFAMLSAEPFFAPAQLAEERGAWPVVRAFADAVGPSWFVWCVLALVGLVLARRAYGRRRFAAVWALLFVVPLAGAAFLLRPGLFADRLGALLPSVFALVGLSALGVGLSLESIGTLHKASWVLHGARALAFFALFVFLRVAPVRSSHDGAALDALSDLTRRNLPEGALVLSYDADTLLRHMGGEVEERLRPDVHVVPLSLLEPAPLESLIEREPELGPLLRDVIVRGNPAPATLQSLAAQRPVFLELEARVRPEVYPTLVSEGLLSRVLSDNTTHGDERMAAQRVAPRLSYLEKRLRLGPPGPDVAPRLALKLSYQALQAASLDDRELGKQLLGLAGMLAPESERVRALRAALNAPGTLDVLHVGGFE